MILRLPCQRLAESLKFWLRNEYLTLVRFQLIAIKIYRSKKEYIFSWALKHFKAKTKAIGWRVMKSNVFALFSRPQSSNCHHLRRQSEISTGSWWCVWKSISSYRLTTWSNLFHHQLHPWQQGVFDDHRKKCIGYSRYGSLLCGEICEHSKTYTRILQWKCILRLRMLKRLW